MKKEVENKKSTKAATIPLNESDLNQMKQRMEAINSKLKEKQTKEQKIVQEYFEFDINTTAKQKLINLKTQMVNQELINAAIIKLIESVLNNGSENKVKKNSNVKSISSKKVNMVAQKPKDEEEIKEEEDTNNSSEEEEEEEESEEISQSLSEENEKIQSQSKKSIRLITQVKSKKTPLKCLPKIQRNSINQNTSQSRNTASDKNKSSDILPQSKDIKKQQSLNIINSQSQKSNRTALTKQQFYKPTEEQNKKTEQTDNQAFQKYLKELQKASTDYSLDIPKYFLDEMSFKKRLDNKFFNVRSLGGKEDKQFVAKLVKSLMNNQTRASQMLALSKLTIQRIVEGSSVRRKVVWKKKPVYCKSKQEEDSGSQSSNEEDESESDEGSTESDQKDKRRKYLRDLIIKEEEEEEQEFLKEHEWLRKEGLLQQIEIKIEGDDSSSQLESSDYCQQDIKIEEEEEEEEEEQEEQEQEEE